jgi:pilus assembly protein CpaB
MGEYVSRRLIILLVAVLLAALGALMVWLYVQNLQAGVDAEEQPTTVLVAQTSIAPGTTGAAAQEAGAFDTIEVPAYAVADGALSDPSSILEQVALVPIATGEQILASKFGTPGQQESFAIPEGKLAASVQLGDPQRVAGFIKPSSEVAVFVTLPVENVDQTRVVLPRIEVLATGQTTVQSITTQTEQGEQTTEQIPAAILTLALTQEEAQKIIFAQSQGQLYLGLLNDTSVTDAAVPATTISNLFAQ